MAKKSKALSGLPLKVQELIRRMGSDLRVSRLRRGITQQDMAERMFVSAQTLQRIENGDPAVSIGIWLSCAFCLNRLDEIKDVLSTRNDVYGNILEERKRSVQRRARGEDREKTDDLDF